MLCRLFSIDGTDHKHNQTTRTISEHLETVNRLYDNQSEYDKKLEINKFLLAQYEMR